MTHQCTNCQPASNKPINYTISFDSPIEAISALRHKIDSLGVVFSGFADVSGYTESALVGVLLFLHDIQKHAAVLEDLFLEQQQQRSNCDHH